MKNLLTIAALFITYVACAQTGWEKTMITESVTVSFPAKPTKTEASAGIKMFILRHADSTANYVALASDLAITMGIDEATLSAEMEKEESWELTKSTFVGTMGADAKLVQNEMIDLKGHKAMKLIIERKNSKGAINIMTAYIFVKGTVSYNIIFTDRGGKADEKIKEKFFDSIVIK